MRNPVRTSRFKQDVELARRRGNYSGRRECHVEPDWLLVYKLFGADIIFERTGTHSELFR